MSRSFLAAIRQAVMQEPTAVEPAAPPASTHHSAAHAEGVAAVTARFSAILKADGIAGNAARMDAAVDLATRSPDMAADDVTAFVITNVAAVAAALAAPSAALANRFSLDPVTGARADPNAAFPVAFGGGLPPTAADGWAEAIAKAAGKNEPAK